MAVSYCGHCGHKENPVYQCYSCKLMRYCSQECQDEDRHLHQLLCEDFANFVKKPNLDDDLRRAILLPAGDVTPLFIWLPIEIMSDDGEAVDQDVDFAHDLGVRSYDSKSGSTMPDEEHIPEFGEECASYYTLVCGNMGGRERLDHSIKLMVREDFTECAPNKCLERLLGHEIASQFRGPVLFIRMTKVEDSAYTLDIDSTDFTLALDGLVEFAKKQADPLAYLANGGPKPKQVTSVLANRSMPFYQETKVLRSNELFTTSKLSVLADKLGMPLRTDTYSNVGRELDPSAQSPALSVAYLHLSIDPIASDFGTIPASIKHNTASVVIVNGDKTALTISSVVALCEFIEDVAQPTLLKPSIRPRGTAKQLSTLSSSCGSSALRPTLRTATRSRRRMMTRTEVLWMPETSTISRMCVRRWGRCRWPRRTLAQGWGISDLMRRFHKGGTREALDE